MSENSLAACTSSSQGVRQLWPSDVLASAPGGFDSIRSACVGAEEVSLTSDEEHAAKAKPHATTATTRLMTLNPRFPRLKKFKKCGSDEESMARASGVTLRITLWLVLGNELTARAVVDLYPVTASAAAG